MRYLCLGSVEANALAYALTLRQHEALSAPLTLSNETLAYLVGWAEAVLVTHPDQASRLPLEAQGKVTCIELGNYYGKPWGLWHHPDLMSQVQLGLDQLLGPVPSRLFPGSESIENLSAF